MAGTGSTTSSLTSTSHTLTQAPGMASFASASPKDAAAIASFIDSIKPANRHTLVQPPPSIPAASLQFAKSALDAFAGQVGDEQQQRLKELGKKRKRDGSERFDVLKIRKLHIDGFETGQVWQQAKRIISSTLDLSNETLKELEDSNLVEAENNDTNGDAKLLEFGEDGFEVGTDADDDNESSVSSDESEGDGEDGSEDAESTDEDAEVSVEDDDGVDEEHADGLLEDEDEEDEEEDDEDEEENGGDFVEDPNGLNDGFFSIDDFNKQTQWFEEQDAKADPNTDLASDDEDVNWHADPFTTSAVRISRASRKQEDDEDLDGLPFDVEDDEDDEEEAGPTFGNMPLDAPEGASDDEFGGGSENGLDDGIDLTANDIFYKDFFAPPPRKGQKGDKPRKPRSKEPSQPDKGDIDRAMADVRRDLFDDMSERSDSEDALSDVSAGDPKARRSTHERRLAKLAEEIRKLESESVAKRAWTMSGEAAAVDRPMNSLLEEDLEFEHAGKPVPVITEEVSEDIEALIKRRILADEFDEIIRRRPDADLSTDARRGLVELDDTKAQKSLAEIYEEEHVKNSNPDSYVSQSDEKLRKEEKEIEQMWTDISGKLDALSSWHYRPKPAAPSLTVVADVATVAMEDAQPTTAQGVSGGESMIAPQEVYNPGKDTAESGEVVSKGGLPVARQELSREDKTRRRRREKERLRKSGGETSKTLNKKAQAQKDTISDLKKGGVKVINRKGEVVDVDGNKAKASKEVNSGTYKL